MSLRSVLGLSKVKKKKSSASRARASATASASASSSSPLAFSTSTWATSVPRIKPGSRRGDKKAAKDEEEEEEDYFQDGLDDFGLVSALATDMQFQDVPQAMRYALGHMFEPVPLQGAGAGLNSTQIVAHRQYRAALPPVVSIAHLQALLRSPTAVEREVAGLIRAGTVRRILVPGRSAVGEVLILSSTLEDLVRATHDVDASLKTSFLRWLEANPAAQLLPSEIPGLGPKQMDVLIRAGFLTAQNLNLAQGPTGLAVRPEDTYTMISLERVSQAASGTMDAVGGGTALVSAGGSGAGRGLFATSGKGSSSEAIRVAVPGHGPLLKLMSTALEHLVGLVHDAPYRQMPESDLRERWNGGLVAGDGRAAQAKRARGEFVGVLPGRTKKWRDFHGLTFDFILHEAVGTGRLEVFRAGAVGRAVRLV